MTDKQRKICEDLGWEVYETEDDIEFRKCSSLGEDFGFSVKADKFLEEFAWLLRGFRSGRTRSNVVQCAK